MTSFYFHILNRLELPNTGVSFLLWTASEKRYRFGNRWARLVYVR